MLRKSNNVNKLLTKLHHPTFLIYSPQRDIQLLDSSHHHTTQREDPDDFKTLTLALPREGSPEGLCSSFVASWYLI